MNQFSLNGKKWLTFILKNCFMRWKYLLLFCSKNWRMGTKKRVRKEISSIFFFWLLFSESLSWHWAELKLHMLCDWYLLHQWLLQVLKDVNKKKKKEDIHSTIGSSRVSGLALISIKNKKTQSIDYTWLNVFAHTISKKNI